MSNIGNICKTHLGNIQSQNYIKPITYCYSGILFGEMEQIVKVDGVCWLCEAWQTIDTTTFWSTQKVCKIQYKPWCFLILSEPKCKTAPELLMIYSQVKVKKSHNNSLINRTLDFPSAFFWRIICFRWFGRDPKHRIPIFRFQNPKRVRHLKRDTSE